MDQPNPCRYCGTHVPRRGVRGRWPKYCNSICRSRWRKKNEPEKLAQYSKTSAQRRAAAREASRCFRLCSICREFYPVVHPEYDCPNPDCRKRRKAIERVWQGGRLRAEKYGGRIERFNPMEVWQSDRWICHLCGGKVIYGPHKATSPESATIDHLEPLELGGDHTRANVRTAHFYCNRSRGSQGVEAARARLSQGPVNPAVRAALENVQ